MHASPLVAYLVTLGMVCRLQLLPEAVQLYFLFVRCMQGIAQLLFRRGFVCPCSLQQRWERRG